MCRSLIGRSLFAKLGQDGERGIAKVRRFSSFGEHEKMGGKRTMDQSFTCLYPLPKSCLHMDRREGGSDNETDLKRCKRWFEANPVKCCSTILLPSLRVKEYKGTHVVRQVPVIRSRFSLGFSINYPKQDAESSNL